VSRFVGKTALVTGAASSLGVAVTRQIIEGGGRVLGLDVVDAVERLVEEHGDRVTGLVRDVANESDVEDAVRTAEATYGGLDIICNNAAVVGPKACVADTDAAEFDRVIAVNLRGPFLVMKHGIPLLRRRGGGSIVNVSSLGGLQANPDMCAYMSSKGGLLMLTRAAAIDHARDGIRVNAICPGTMDTPALADMHPQDLEHLRSIHPVGRLGRPEEVASFIAFLASEEASFATGGVYVVDGGRSAALWSSRPRGPAADPSTPGKGVAEPWH
jgi:NAD(P)-dependent dehydrogenase (short-subunit alcohol dehydrogenase family)